MEPEQVRNIMDSMIRKLYDMELEELGRSGWQDEKLLSEVRKLLEKNKAFIRVEDWSLFLFHFIAYKQKRW